MEPFSQLGANSPGPGELKSLYICPPRKNALVRAIIACNRDPFQTKIRLTLAQFGSEIGLNDWFYYDADLFENDTMIYSHEGEGFPVGPGMELRSYSLNGQVTFKVLGEERYLRPPT